MNRNNIKFYTNCIPVRGFERSLIYDLPRQNADYIPNSLYEIMSNCDGYTLKDIKLKYHNDDNGNEIIDEYFLFLKSKDYLFLCSKDELKLYPPLNLSYENPSYITNAVIEIKNTTLNNINKKLIKEFDSLLCNAIQLRVLEKIPFEKLKNILLIFEKSNVEIIELIVKYSDISYEDLIKQFTRINRIIIFSAPYSKSINLFENKKNICYINEDIYFNCELINKQNMIVNMPFFTESQHYNTCLNRKICIDENGEIKNCPAMKHSFGNIKNSTMEEALNKPGFKDLWGIRKDYIDVCKDCEFRYMCTDCRCFIKNPNDIYSQPAKCPYNPYIAKWESEEGYVPVEECGNYTRETGFVPNKRKINKLNKQIWSE